MSDTARPVRLSGDIRAEARRMAAAGYGWEDLVAILGLPQKLARYVVFGN